MIQVQVACDVVHKPAAGRTEILSRLGNKTVQQAGVVCNSTENLPRTPAPADTQPLTKKWRNTCSIGLFRTFGYLGKPRGEDLGRRVRRARGGRGGEQGSPFRPEAAGPHQKVRFSRPPTDGAEGGAVARYARLLPPFVARPVTT